MKGSTVNRFVKMGKTIQKSKKVLKDINFLKINFQMKVIKVYT